MPENQVNLNKKYFIAIVLPEPIQSQVEAMKDQLFKQFNLKGALRSPSHITLHRPFEWKQEKESKLIDSLMDFNFGKPFQLDLKDYNCFAPRVIYVDVVKNEALYDVHKRLKYYAQENLKLLNEVEDMRGFHPHATIAFRDLRKNKFEEVWSVFKEKKYQANFEVKSFSLLRLEDKWKEIRYFEK